MKKTKGYISAFLVLALIFFMAPSVEAAGNAYTLEARTISAGTGHAGAIDNNNSLWMWGLNTQGQLGNGSTTASATPIKVMDDVVSIAFGDDCSYAIESDGSLWAWGFSRNYRLAVDESAESESGRVLNPVKIMDDVKYVEAGIGCAFAIKSDDSLWAWGNGADGQLGTGSTPFEQKTPQKIMDNVSSVSSNYYITAAVTNDGGLWLWGDNQGGMIIGSDGNQLTPKKVMDGVKSCDVCHDILVVKQDDSLWAWGDNGYSQLFTGDENKVSSPTKVMSGVKNAYAGGFFSFALKTDNTLVGAGDNSYGNVGVGDTGRMSVKTPSVILDNVAAASTYRDMTVALKSDGTVWHWGHVLNDEINRPAQIMTNVKMPSNVLISGNEGSLPVPTGDSPSSWAVDSVNSAIAAGLVPENLKSKYTAATTRAEFCALATALYEKVKGSEIIERTSFTDTTDVNVQKMAAVGVVTGVGENKFSPDSKLTREQAATMLARLGSAIGKPLPTQPSTFADNNSISSWAISSVGQVQAAGIMSGVGDNKFSPAADYTREQSIMTIMRLYDEVK